MHDSLLYEAKRTLHIEHVPEWAWVNATPVENTQENINELQIAYLHIHEILKAQDLESLKKETALAMGEWARAEESSPEVFFASLGFEGDFKQGFKEIEPDWGSYKLLSFMGGRLVQLEGKRNFSPLVMRREGDEKGIDDLTYAPFFSLINGKFVIVR
jgi:hypothetical protein